MDLVGDGPGVRGGSARLLVNCFAGAGRKGNAVGVVAAFLGPFDDANSSVNVGNCCRLGVEGSGAGAGGVNRARFVGGVSRNTSAGITTSNIDSLARFAGLSGDICGGGILSGGEDKGEEGAMGGGLRALAWGVEVGMLRGKEGGRNCCGCTHNQLGERGGEGKRTISETSSIRELGLTGGAASASTCVALCGLTASSLCGLDGPFSFFFSS